MRIGLIGCGVVLLILVVLAFLAGDYVVGHWKEMNKKLEEIAADYRRLDKEYPFEKPPEAKVSPEQGARFTRCRTLLMDRLESWRRKMKDEESSGFKKVTNMLFQGIPDIGRGHVEALEQVKMSPAEYHWLLGQLLLVLRYAESPDAPQGLKDLRKAFDELPEVRSVGSGGDAEREGKAWVYGDADYAPRSLLPAVEPSQLRIAPETIQAFLDQKEAIEKTFSLFLNFDGAFINAYHELHRKAPSAPPAGAGVKEGK